MLSFFKPKIFCISFQRTGTTSIGNFFKDHRYKVAGYGFSLKNNWTYSWVKGNNENIFKSFDFLRHQVFEDDPWWCLNFYETLFLKFPKSKFILLERDPDKWFDSMLSHSKGRTLGNTYIHSFVYDRIEEFNNLNCNLSKRYTHDIDNLLPLNEEHREHYKEIYITRNNEVKKFFSLHNPDRLFNGYLEDKMIWVKIGNFFSIKVDKSYISHSNSSKY